MNIELSNFELQTPVKSGKSVLIVSPKDLVNYSSTYFYSNPDKSITFMCPANGARTPNTDFPRCELREVASPSQWNLTGLHNLNVTCKVVKLDGGKGIVISQIHGTNPKLNPQLVKLFWRTDNTVLIEIKNDANPDGKEIQLALGKYTLGELIKYSLQIQNGTLTVCVMGSNSVINKQTATFKNPYWNQQLFYFKAGNYLQNNKGDDYGAVQIYNLITMHQ